MQRETKRGDILRQEARKAMSIGSENLIGR
jgi:hypothetical protein